MKRIKKMMTILLAVVMVLGMSLPTMVGASEDGSITINNAVVGQTYKIYRIFDLESYDVTSDGDTETGTYAYKVNLDWEDFIEHITIEGVYVDVDSNGYVTWHDNASQAEFAKLAREYAANHSSTVTCYGSTEAITQTVVFDELTLGYYLVDSSLGLLCSLDTTNPNVEMQEKNVAPTLDKKVKNSTDSNYSSDTSESIGKNVSFQLTVTVGSNGVGVNASTDTPTYTIIDTIPSGLTYNDDCAVTNAKLATGDYTVSCDNNILKVILNNTGLAKLSTGDVVTITYSAKLNSNANVGSTGNVNTARLTYGSYTTQDVQATVYTYSFDLVKTDKDNNVLSGAKFSLYGSKAGTDKIYVSGDAANGYKVSSTDTNVDIEAGNVTISGLGNGTYYLEETTAPEGYNKLLERVEITISDGNLVASFNETDSSIWSSGGVHVVNYTGSELPSTGGMGTTIIYIIGAALVIISGVLLITKKRMGSDK